MANHPKRLVNYMAKQSTKEKAITQSNLLAPMQDHLSTMEQVE
jgi:hypothetical protein